MKYILLLIALILIFKYKVFTSKTLIINGNVIFKNLNDDYNFDNLLQDLIKNNIYDLKNIEKAYLKNGKLKLVTSKPHVIISNGIIDNDELKKINKNKLYIYNVLNENKVKIEEILYAIYLNHDLYIVKNC